MKKIFLGLLLMSSLVACNNSSSSSKESKDSTVTTPKEVAKPDNKNESIKMIIQQLKDFQAAYNAKDINKIKQFFTFPMPDSALEILSINEKAYADIKNNKGLISEEIFTKHFNTLYNYWDPKVFNNFFKHFPFDSLQYKNEIDFEGPQQKNERCYEYYQASIHNDTLEFSYGMNSNPSYVPNNKIKKSDEDMDECDEFAIIWRFKFDGKKLILIDQRAAG